MIYPMTYNRYGYGWLSPIRWKDGKPNSFHPGVDLNYTIKSGFDDLGKPVIACANGEVVYARNTGWGWGNLVVIWHPQLNVWSRYAHFKTVNVKVGDKIAMGDLVGTCGMSGTTSPHLHFEIIIEKLGWWTQYVYGWGKEKVCKYFTDPIEFINKNILIN